MNIPSLSTAESLLSEGEHLSPGSWVAHSRHVAQAARLIASYHPELDAEAAYVLGLLHDIGRRAGEYDMRHVIDGYNFLRVQGYTDAARICLTHSYPIPDARACAGEWDGSPQELRFLEDYLAKIEYDDYDRLIQLCDALALPSGFCLVEKRLVDVSLRRGVNEYTVSRWQTYLQLRQDFDNAIGCPVYTLLPGIVENTFGVDPRRRGAL